MKTKMIIVLWMFLVSTMYAQVADFTVAGNCEDQSITFTNTSIGIPAGAIYTWDFVDPFGPFLPGPGPQVHNYAAPGVYPVRLDIILPSGAVVSKVKNVTIDPAPVVNFVAPDVCLGLPTPFLDASIPNSPIPIVYNWDFGDFSSSALQNPIHNYAAAAVYPVKLEVTNSHGCQSNFTQNVTVFALPVPDFAAPITCEDFPVAFNNLTLMPSGAPITNWTWDFGDPLSGGLNAAIIQNPSHLYVNPGPYNVTLNVVDANLCINQVVMPIIIDPALPIDFFHQYAKAPVGACSDLVLHTIDESCNNLLYNWTFGDGTTGTGAYPPVHNYPAGDPMGSYSVILNAAGTASCYANTIVMDLSKKGNNIDLSCGNLSNWSGEHGNWGGGAGNGIYTPGGPMANPVILPVQTQVHPIVPPSGDDLLIGALLKTTPPGKKAVQIGNIGGGGEYNRLEYTIHVDPYNSLLLYSFAAVFEEGIGAGGIHPIAVAPHFEVDVYDKATGTPLGCAHQYYWADRTDPLLRPAGVSAIPGPGGGSMYWRAWTTTGIDLSPYMNNDVVLRFTVSDCGYVQHTGYAYVTAELAAPEIDIQYCYNDNQAILTAPAGFEYQWYYTDAAGAAIAGPNTQIFNYNIPAPCTRVWCEITSGGGGCPFRINAKLEPSIVTPDFKHDVDVCLGTAVNFTDQSITYNYCDPTKCPKIVDWEWDFGDANSYNGQNPPPHIYAASGVYDVTLTVRNDQDCEETITKKVYVWDPIANFTALDVCLGKTMDFNDASVAQVLGALPDPVITNNIIGWDWDFGDFSAHDITQNPVHTYAAVGAYAVTLEIQTDKGCKVSITKPVNVWALPTADFNSVNLCKGAPVNFVDASIPGSGVMATYLWNFGNGNVSNLANPTNVFNAAVQYDVHLIVTNNHGCIDDTVKRISIIEAQADFTCNPVCFGDKSLFLNNSTTNGLPIVLFDWNFGDLPSGAANVSNLEDPEHEFSIPGSQYVTFTVETPEGCIATIQKQVQVLENPVVKFSSNIDEGCPILCVDFTDYSNSGDPITTWTWNIDNHYYSTQNATHCFDESGLRNVELTVTSSKGCTATLMKAAMINVYPAPMAEFSYLPTSIYSKNPEVEFTNLSSGAVSYKWAFDHFGTSTDINPTFTFPLDTAGIYRVCLEAMGANDCPDTACKNIEVLSMYEFMATNTFTPNGDGINDDFRPVILGADQEHFEYWIFNRWGELIYTSNYYTAWDGTHQGKLVKEDVYVWKVIARELSTGDEHEYYGHVLALINTGRR